MLAEYEALKKLVEDGADDVQKAAAGNKTAGTRVRKRMQDVKVAAQAIRKMVMAGRKDKSTPDTPTVPGAPIVPSTN